MDHEEWEIPSSRKQEFDKVDLLISNLVAAKEYAIAEQDFENAAQLRDQGEQLGRRKKEILWEWPKTYPVDPSWLTWNNGTVAKLALSIHQNQRWEELPILADALEEAGCTDTEMLDHCRQPVKHELHCWVVDVLLRQFNEPN